MKLPLLLALSVLAAPAAWADSKPAAADDGGDLYQWLEETAGDKAMDWVKARNAETVSALASTPAFAQMKSRVLEVLDSDARIPYVLRRASTSTTSGATKSTRAASGGARRWTSTARPSRRGTVLIDLDALGKAEKENWVWHGARCLQARRTGAAWSSLSRGGADADVVREFDVEKRASCQSGFTLPEAKSNVAWRDADTLFVGTDFGPGSLTDSGYPRIAKVWKRGTPLSRPSRLRGQARRTSAVSCLSRPHPRLRARLRHARHRPFYDERVFLLGKDGKLTLIDVPDDAEIERRNASG